MANKAKDALVISVSKPETYEAILADSGDVLLTKIRDGEIVVPKSESREDFSNFAIMNEDARKAFIQSIKPASSDGAGADGTGDTKVPPLPGDKPVDESGKATPPPPADEAGAGSPGSIEKSHQELMTQLSISNKESREHRIAAGRLGKELKTAKKSLEEARTEIADLRKTAIPAPKDAPEMPDMPNPEDFVEGVMDKGYQEAQIEHHKKMGVYQKELTAYQNSTRPEWASKLSDEFDKISQKAEEAKTLAQSSAKTAAVTATDSAWGGMWDYIRGMQKTLNLPTSIDINVINDNQTILNADKKGLKNEDQTPVYSQAEVNTAKTILSGLSEADYANYGKAVKLINQLYVFDTPEGLPEKRFEGLQDTLALQSAIDSAGLSEEVKALEPAPPNPGDVADRLSQKQANDNNLAHGMPAGGVGGADANLGSELTDTEKKEKCLDMAKQLNANPKLKHDTSFMESFNTLRSGLGLAKK